MDASAERSAWRRAAAIAVAIGALLPAAGSPAAEVKLEAIGSQEVPPVRTPATARGAIEVGVDRSVSGSLTVVGFAPTEAHIHLGAPGTSGAVVIALFRNGDVLSVPSGAKLSEAQYAAFRAGNLYVDVHSPTHPQGEIRAQLRP